MENNLGEYYEKLTDFENEISYEKLNIMNSDLSVLGINELARIRDRYTDLLWRVKSYLSDIAKKVDTIGVENLEAILSYGKRLIDQITDNRLDVVLEYTAKDADVKRLESYLPLLKEQRKEENKRIRSVENTINKLKSFPNADSFAPAIRELEESVAEMRKSVSEIDDKQSQLRNDLKLIVTGGKLNSNEPELNNTEELKENVQETEGYIGRHLKPEDMTREPEFVENSETSEDSDELINSILADFDNSAEADSVSEENAEGKVEEEVNEEINEPKKPLIDPLAEDLEEYKPLEEEESSEVLDGVPPMSDEFTPEFHEEESEKEESSPEPDEEIKDVPPLIKDESLLDVPDALGEELKEVPPSINPSLKLGTPGKPSSDKKMTVPDLLDGEEYEAEVEQSKPALWVKIAAITLAAGAFLTYIVSKLNSKKTYPNEPMDFEFADYQEEEETPNEEEKTEEEVSPSEEEKQEEEQSQNQEEGQSQNQEGPSQEEPKKEEEPKPQKNEEWGYLPPEGSLNEEIYDQSTKVGVTTDGTVRQYDDNNNYTVINNNSGNTTVNNNTPEAPKAPTSTNMTEEEARKGMSANQEAQLDNTITYDIDWDKVFPLQNENSLGH